MWRPSEAADWLAAALVLVAAASVVSGLILVGGPGQARQEREDAARLAALIDTAQALNCYRRGIGSLPEDVGRIRAAIEDPASPARRGKGCHDATWRRDPISGEPFELERVDDQTARLCAVFAHAGVPVPDGYRRQGDPWIDSRSVRTGPGRHCYIVDLTVEPD